MVVLRITLSNGQVVETEVPRAMIELMISTLKLPIASSGPLSGMKLTIEVTRESAMAGPFG